MQLSMPKSGFFLWILLWATAIMPATDTTSSVPTTPNDSDVFRVMTYNVRREGSESKPERLWPNRLSLICSLIKKLNPDIFGLQEPTLNQLDGILQDLTSTGLPFGAFGEGRGSSWGGKGANEYNPIFYRTDKLELLEQGTFAINHIKSMLENMSGFKIWWPWYYQQTGLLPRISTWGKFKQQSTGQEFYLYNTHFDHQYEAARELCAKTLAAHIAQQNTENLPVIITGDLNTEFTGPVRDLLTGFTPALETARIVTGPRETETGWTEDKLKQIDHILIDDKVNVLTHSVVPKEEGQPYPSDHRPVVADLEFVK